jgi:hypothetical protein
MNCQFWTISQTNDARVVLAAELGGKGYNNDFIISMDEIIQSGIGRVAVLDDDRVIFILATESPSEPYKHFLIRDGGFTVLEWTEASVQ